MKIVLWDFMELIVIKIVTLIVTPKSPIVIKKKEYVPVVWINITLIIKLQNVMNVLILAKTDALLRDAKPVKIKKHMEHGAAIPVNIVNMKKLKIKWTI